MSSSTDRIEIRTVSKRVNNIIVIKEGEDDGIIQNYG